MENVTYKLAILNANHLTIGHKLSEWLKDGWEISGDLMCIPYSNEFHFEIPMIKEIKNKL